MTQIESLDKRIRTAIDNLSTKQKRLARFILKNKYFMAFASASEVGEKTDTSAATVVRFAQLLGYEGFTELQTGIRAELPSYLKAVEDIQARQQKGMVPENIAKQVLYQEIANLERTANNLNASNLDAAIEEIIKADQILVVGSGLSSAAATYLAHSLNVIGFNARENTSGGLRLAVDIAQLKPGQLIVGIDMWRYLRSTLEALSAAKKYGARTIAITDNNLSPLAQAANYAFEVATDGVAHSYSATAILTLINVFIAKLSYRIPDQLMQSLQRVDSAYRDSDLFTVE